MVKRLRMYSHENSGSGKTHLLMGLGIKDCYAGFNVKYFTLDSYGLTSSLRLSSLAHLFPSLAGLDKIAQAAGRCDQNDDVGVTFDKAPMEFCNVLGG